jgi:hypothetical protein
MQALRSSSTTGRQKGNSSPAVNARVVHHTLMGGKRRDKAEQFTLASETI